MEIERPVHKLYPVEVPNDSPRNVPNTRTVSVDTEEPAIRFVSEDEVEVVRRAKRVFETNIK